MSGTLIRASLVLTLGLILGARATRLLKEGRRVPGLLQLSGALGLLLVGLSHVAEALSLLSFMGWGQSTSSGHYLDLLGAIAALTLVPTGYVTDILMRHLV